MKKLIADVIAENIERLKEDRGIDRDGKLAKLSTVDQKSIWRIRHKEQSPSADTLERIAQAFGLQAWQLLVPDLDPKNLPVVTMSDTERDLYRKLSEMAAELVAQQESKRYP